MTDLTHGQIVAEVLPRLRIRLEAEGTDTLTVRHLQFMVALREAVAQDAKRAFTSGHADALAEKYGISKDPKMSPLPTPEDYAVLLARSDLTEAERSTLTDAAGVAGDGEARWRKIGADIDAGVTTLDEVLEEMRDKPVIGDDGFFPDGGHRRTFPFIPPKRRS